MLLWAIYRVRDDQSENSCLTRSARGQTAAHALETYAKEGSCRDLIVDGDHYFVTRHDRDGGGDYETHRLFRWESPVVGRAVEA